VEKLHGKSGDMEHKETFDRTFDGKTIFVTGHTGFIGTWLITWLHNLGAKVVGFSLDIPTKPSMFEILDLAKDITHIMGDVKNSTHLEKCMSEFKPDMVFHLAAQPLVRLSYEKPVETFQTNVMGTANVLESIRKIPSVKVCIVMTSDKCYENREVQYAYKENDPLGGHDPYSASKGATELVVLSYRKSFFTKINKKGYQVGISTIRAGNVIGGGDWAEDRIVPDCIRSLMSKKDIQIRNPNSIRPWQFVLEPISGMLFLAMKMWKNPSHFSGPWNFGPPLSSPKNTVKELVLQIIDEWGEGKWIDVSQQSTIPPHEANLLMLDSTKAETLLGWSPVYNLKEAITKTMSWYNSYVDKPSQIKDFTKNQIQNYAKKAKQMNIMWAN
jgi:CDP-glucose 4,6-dehydratase